MLNKYLLTCYLLLMLTACQNKMIESDSYPISENPAVPFTEKTFVYTCEDNYSFVAHQETAESVWLFLPTNTTKLTKTTSASGVKFIGYDEHKNSLLFWQKNQQALFIEGNLHYKDCQNDRKAAIWEQAKLMGVDFRAIGQEPGWSITISQEHGIKYQGNYGQLQVEFPYQKPRTINNPAKSTFELSNERHQLTIILTPLRCTDSMSGEQYETSVELTFDNKVLKGCGKSLH